MTSVACLSDRSSVSYFSLTKRFVSYVVEIVKPLKERKTKTLLVMFAFINKADLTLCSHLSIHSDETLLIVSQVFNAVARVTMQHSI